MAKKTAKKPSLPPEFQPLASTLEAMRDRIVGAAKMRKMMVSVDPKEAYRSLLAGGEEAALAAFHAMAPVQAAKVAGELALEEIAEGRNPDRIVQTANRFAASDAVRLDPKDFGLGVRVGSHVKASDYVASVNKGPLKRTMDAILAEGEVGSDRLATMTARGAQPQLKAAENIVGQINAKGVGVLTDNPFVNVALTDEAERAAMLTQAGRIEKTGRAAKQQMYERLFPAPPIDDVKAAMAGVGESSTISATERRLLQDLAHVDKLVAAGIPKSQWPKRLLNLPSSRGAAAVAAKAAGGMSPLAEGLAAGGAAVVGGEAVQAVGNKLGLTAAAKAAPAAAAEAAEGAGGVAKTAAKAARFTIPTWLKVGGGALVGALLAKQVIDTLMSTSREDEERRLADFQMARDSGAMLQEEGGAMYLQKGLARLGSADDQLQSALRARLGSAMSALSPSERDRVRQIAQAIPPSAAELYANMKR